MWAVFWLKFGGGDVLDVLDMPALVPHSPKFG